MSISVTGKFFVSKDKTELYEVCQQVGPAQYLCSCYRDLKPPSLKILTVHQIVGFHLYASKEAAASAEIGGAK
jgi:hypothetical protein